MAKQPEIQVFQGFDFANFRKVSFDIMKAYIDTLHPEDKEAFKAAAIQEVEFDRTLKSGKVKHYNRTQYNHLAAARWFYSKYFPEFLPVAKEKKDGKNVMNILANW